MAAGHRRRVFIFLRLCHDIFHKNIQFTDDDLQRLLQPQGARSVFNIAACQSEMDIAAFRTDMICHIRVKGDHVMLHLSFDPEDLIGVKTAFFVDLFHRFRRNDPVFGPCMTNCKFDDLPAAVLVFQRPDFFHFFCFIACDHCSGNLHIKFLVSRFQKKAH